MIRKYLKPFAVQVMNLVLAVPLAMGILVGHDVIVNYGEIGLFQFVFGLVIGLVSINIVASAIAKDLAPYIQSSLGNMRGMVANWKAERSKE
jgi:hypothetical protein